MGLTTDYFSLGKNGGLPKINKIDAKQLVENFQLKKQGQPSVIIERSDWEKLCHPRRFQDGTNTKIPQGDYEVYALVFCFGIWDYSADFFFRIRRIYKPANKPRYKGKLYIDDKNIAFADPTDDSIGRNSNEFGIKFVNEIDDPDKYNLVNLFVDMFKKSVKDNSSFSNSLPLVEMSSYDKPIIQEGNIFGKKRILDDLLNDKYSLLNRQRASKPPVDFVRVNFALDTSTNNILFVFNINDDYSTGIKCPAPQVCQ